MSTNIKNFSSIKQQTVKVQVSKNFLSAINEAKSEIHQSYDETDDDYKSILIDAINSLDWFSRSNKFNSDNFEIAAEQLFESININPNKSDSYYYLAWLFHFSNENELAMKYLKIAISLNRNITGVEYLQDSIARYLVEERNSLEPTTNKKSKPVNQIIDEPLMINGKTEQKVRLQPMRPRTATFITDDINVEESFEEQKVKLAPLESKQTLRNVNSAYSNYIRGI